MSTHLFTTAIAASYQHLTPLDIRLASEFFRNITTSLNFSASGCFRFVFSPRQRFSSRTTSFEINPPPTSASNHVASNHLAFHHVDPKHYSASNHVDPKPYSASNHVNFKPHSNAGKEYGHLLTPKRPKTCEK